MLFFCKKTPLLFAKKSGSYIEKPDSLFNEDFRGTRLFCE